MPPVTNHRWYHVRQVTVFLFAVFFVAGILFERFSNTPVDDPPDSFQSTKESVMELTLQKFAIQEKLRKNTSPGEDAERNRKLALGQIDDIDFTIGLECENMERVRIQLASLND